MKSSVAIPALVSGVPLGAPPRSVSLALRFFTLTGAGGLAMWSLCVSFVLLGDRPLHMMVGALALASFNSIYNFGEGRRALRVLVHGVFGEGRHVDTGPARARWWRWRWRKDNCYEHTFEVTTDEGERVYVTASDHRVRGVDEDEPEAVIYDPRDPDRGFLLDALPGSPRLSPDGHFVCAPKRVLAELAFAALGVVVLSLFRWFA